MNSQSEFYPEFYRKFKCTAGQCPDTCCKDWDVVVDDEAYEFYSDVTGEFGERLASHMKIDDDGDRVFVFENGVCPFLNGERLCEIQVRFGEERVCGTCREFPRISHDYTEFTEHMLSLACPEACRLIIGGFGKFDFPKNRTVQSDDNGYSKEFMNFLLKARDMTVEIFVNNEAPFRNRLKECIAFTEYVQTLIDDELFDESKLGEYEYCGSFDERISREFVFELHKNLDIMDKSWLDDLLSSSSAVLNSTSETDIEFVNLSLYYIYRYYLGAIDSYDIISPIKRLYCAYIVCSAMIAKSGAENDFDKRVLVMQKYSKEVEHSFENVEYLTDFLNT